MGVLVPPLMGSNPILPTTLDKIKNFHHHVHVGGVVLPLSPRWLGKRAEALQTVDKLRGPCLLWQGPPASPLWCSSLRQNRIVFGSSVALFPHRHCEAASRNNSTAAEFSAASATSGGVLPMSSFALGSASASSRA